MKTHLLPLLVLVAIPALGGAPGDDPDHFRKTIFFAVLEGLYEDGVATEDVEMILRLDRGTRHPENFVYGCPICDPARDAFDVYRKRPYWSRYKNPHDTFGRGLGEATRAAIWSEDAERRFEALEGLMREWVSRRLAMQRLTSAERQAYEIAFEEMRKMGMSSIRGGAPAELKRCAMCDGAFGAAR